VSPENFPKVRLNGPQGISPSDIAPADMLLSGDFLLKLPLGRIGSGVEQKEKCYRGPKCSLLLQFAHVFARFCSL
jgi:hypothetical protein